MFEYVSFVFASRTPEKTAAPSSSPQIVLRQSMARFAYAWFLKNISAVVSAVQIVVGAFVLLFFLYFGLLWYTLRDTMPRDMDGADAVAYFILLAVAIFVVRWTVSRLASWMKLQAAVKLRREILLHRRIQEIGPEHRPYNRLMQTWYKDEL